MTPTELASYLDYSALTPDVSEVQIDSLCDEALELGLAAISVAPVWVPRAKKRLQKSDVHVGTTIAFPHGNTLPKVKAHETALVRELGADEVDMVINIAAARANDFAAVQDDIHAVYHAAEGVLIIKVILEVGYLNEEQIVGCCRAAQNAGADYVKTSTGFGPRGATLEDVRLLRASVRLDIGVKAAGGIRDLTTALAMIEAGATRLGTSVAPALVRALQDDDSAG